MSSRRKVLPLRHSKACMEGLSATNQVMIFTLGQENALGESLTSDSTSTVRQSDSETNFVDAGEMSELIVPEKPQATTSTEYHNPSTLRECTFTPRTEGRRSGSDDWDERKSQRRQMIRSLRAERDAAQDERDIMENAMNEMLTELISTQECLLQSQEAGAHHEGELSKLRKEFARLASAQSNKSSRKRRSLNLHGTEGQDGEQIVVDFGEAQRQSRDLWDRCARAEAAVKQLELKIREEESRTSEAMSLAKRHQDQADLSLSQLIQLKEAYAASLLEVQDKNNSISLESVELMRSSLTTELNDACRPLKVFKESCEQLSKQNKEITAERRGLLAQLRAKTQEIEQQASLIEALKMETV